MTISPDDIVRDLQPRHRNAMLDLVLTWGSLDGALGMLLSRVQGVPFAEGAEQIGKLSGSSKLAEVRRILLNIPSGKDAARLVKKHKKAYEKHSFPRNRIAHSHCAGYWSHDPAYVVFAAFERAEDEDLVVDAIPLEIMDRATKWGRAMTAHVLRLVDSSGPADDPTTST